MEVEKGGGFFKVFIFYKRTIQPRYKTIIMHAFINWYPLKGLKRKSKSRKINHHLLLLKGFNSLSYFIGHVLYIKFRERHFQESLSVFYY